MSRPTRERIKQIVNQESPELVAALLESMAEHIENQKALIERIKAEKAEKDQSAFLIEERVKLLRRELFGRSKEDRPAASDRPRDKSQEQALLFSQAAFPSPEKRSNDGKLKGRDLDEVLYEYGLTDAELVTESNLRGYANASNSQWKETGLFEESLKVQIIERRYVREIHRRKKYKLVAGVDMDDRPGVLLPLTVLINPAQVV